MRATKKFTPKQQELIKFSLVTLLERTSGMLFNKAQQDAIVAAWELVRDPTTDEPLVPIVREPSAPRPEPEVYETLTGIPPKDLILPPGVTSPSKAAA
jgi:hypothetical protein